MVRPLCASIDAENWLRGLSSSGTENLHKLAVTPNLPGSARVAQRPEFAPSDKVRQREVNRPGFAGGHFG